MKVKELIKELDSCNQEAEIFIYNEDGEPCAPDSITVANNDDDVPIEYHLYSSDTE